MTADRTPPASRFTPFTPGNKLGGRKVGSRNLLADRFFKDFYALWEEQGEAALRRAFFENPVAVVQIVAKLMPAKLEISTPTAGLTDERFLQLIELAETRLAEMGSTGASPSTTIEGSAIVIEGGGGSPQAGSSGGEENDRVLYSPVSADPDFAAGPLGDPPLSTQALVPEEDDVDPASLF